MPALAAPLRAVLVTMAITPAVVAMLAFTARAYATGAIALAICAATLLAWKILLSGRAQLAASVAFYALAAGLAAMLWFGHGTLGYGMMGFPFVLFLGCVFLAPAAYWGLTACVVAAVTALWTAEFLGLRARGVGPPLQLFSLIGLWVLLVASAAGGRILTRAVRASQERLRKVFHSSQNAIVVSRLDDGTYLEVNDAYLAMFGYRREDVIGRSSLDLGIWEDPRERERFVRQIRESNAVAKFETRFRKRTGEIIQAELSAEALDVDGEKCLVVSAADVTARREAERRAEFLSTRDALTGLPNRALAIDRLRHGIERGKRSGLAIAVLHIDLDRFSALNESVGRVCGDAMLREVCHRLEALLRGGDTLARIGGDEFVLVADSLTHTTDAEHLAGKVLAAFNHSFSVGGRTLRISCSMGVSVFPEHSVDAESLLLYADTAMHLAKSQGRARFCLFDRAMDERARSHLNVETSLRESLAGNQLQLVYQPKFDMLTHAIVGVEALARWSHPELGIVAPAYFISIAEESDLICELGRWAFRESCVQIERWRREGLPAPPIAVNLSAREITPELPGLLSDCVNSRGIDPGMLGLEITETMLIAGPEAARKILEQVAANGNTIMLDDFGVGYSSLSYVKLLHLSGIKVDRSFVTNVTSSRHDKAIVSAIVGLAHGLGFRVVAEGIESEAQLHVLRDLGCDEAQGFHLSRPLSGEQIASEFLTRSPASG